MKTLTCHELEQTVEAVLSGFPTWNDLAQLTAFALDIDLEAEVGRLGGTRTVLFQLIQFTQARGWTEVLLREAIARRPGNPKLTAQRGALGLAREPFAGRNAGFQGRVLRESGLTSLGRWSRLLAEKERRVCQIRRGKVPVGTGFLVAPALVMTNWHVFQDTPDSGNLGATEQYSACFDFRAGESGTVVDHGTTVRFLPEAVRDASHREELDYVIVELAEPAGTALIADGCERGWLHLGTGELELGAAVLVLQHPSGRTMEVAMGGVTGWHRAGAVFEHKAETESGSSGSPCFAANWTLLGLHHRIDPTTGEHNRGITTSAILQRMGAISPPTIGLLPAV